MRRTRDKRQVIIRVAERLFRSRRFHEIKLDDVARLARVGKGTIYLYFKDKDDLFFQTATAGFEELCQVVSSKIPAAAPFPEQLAVACTGIACFFESRHPLFRMIAESRSGSCRGEFQQRWLDQRRRLLEALAGVIRNGVNDGQVRTDVDPEVLAGFLLGMLRTRAMDLAHLPPERYGFDVLIDLFCHGACCPVVRANREK